MQKILVTCLKFSRALTTVRSVHPLHRCHNIRAHRRGLLFERNVLPFRTALIRPFSSSSSDTESDDDDEDYVVRSAWGHIHIPHDATFCKLLLERFLQAPQKTALVNGLTGEKYTYSRLSDHVVRLTDSLAKHGVGSGKVVSFCSPNSVEVALLMMATSLTGAASNMIDSQDTPDEISELLGVSSPDFMVTSSDLLDKVKSSGRSFKQIFTVDKVDSLESYSSLLSEGDHMEGLHGVDSDDTAFINYSRRFPGIPKGVITTHYNIFSQILGISKTRSLIKETDVTTIAFPFAHSAGIIVLLTALESLSTTVVLPSFDLRLYLETIQNHKITQITIPPSLSLRLFNDPMVDEYDLSSLRAITCVGGPKRLAQLKVVMDKLDIPIYHQAYGITEGSGFIYIDAEYDTCMGSAGKVIPNNHCKIVDPSTGKDLAPTATGEIWIKGPSVMAGYFNDPEGTKSCLTEDGWFKTGDIGYHNDRGHLFIVDRMEDLIKYKGLQVSPSNLEAFLLNHPDIADAAVIGVPDETFGEVPKAWIVLKPGRVRNEEMEENIHEFINDSVAHYKRLRGGISFIDEIPKLPSGKIMKRTLRGMEQK